MVAGRSCEDAKKNVFTRRRRDVGSAADTVSFCDDR